ncbi:MAG: DUF2281 domain-containing protein [Cytophagaceae bacterium]|nr:MAG: DUF2281 domain-containing protein [Cytophagaceae bacterium]
MSTVQLVEEIATLPTSLQEQVRDFVAFLKTRHPQPEPPLKQRQFGAGKGLISMADDFDAPLDDFKEYM